MQKLTKNLTLDKQTNPNTYIQKPKPKPIGPSSALRTAHMSVCNWVKKVVHNRAQNSSDNIHSNLYSLDVFYWRGEVTGYMLLEL